MVTFLRAFWLASLLWQVGSKHGTQLYSWSIPSSWEFPNLSHVLCPILFQACFSLDWNIFSSISGEKSIFQDNTLLLDLSLFCHIWEFGNNCLQTLTALVSLILSHKLLVKDLKPFACFNCFVLVSFYLWSKGSWNQSDSLVWVPFISCTGHSVSYNLASLLGSFRGILSPISTVLCEVLWFSKQIFSLFFVFNSLLF